MKLNCSLHLLVAVLVSCGEAPVLDLPWEAVEPVCEELPPVAVSDLKTCSSAEECPSAPSRCLLPVCTGKCGFEAAPAGARGLCGGGWVCSEDGRCCDH